MRSEYANDAIPIQNSLSLVFWPVEWSEVGFETEFFPPNVFTPNNDGHNDYFAVEGIDPFASNPNPDATVAFPPDNCQGQFESVKIFNRWGNPVFESTERKFRWYAPNQAAGVYYYVIKFTNKEYRGSLSVRI